MPTEYKELFSIECLHGYFADRRCRVLSLSPTPECESMLQRYRMLFRRTVSGGKVLGCVQDGALVPAYSETTPLAFTLVSTDPLLDAYTEAPSESNASKGDSLHYFSNRVGGLADAFGQQRLLLHPDKKPFENQARRQLFTYRFTKPVQAAKLRLAEVLSGETVWEAQTPEKQTVDAWPIDLREQQPGHPMRASGRYALEVNGSKALDFYLTEAPGPNLWGVVEIFPGGPSQANIPKACQVIDAAGKLEPKAFAIELASRETFWRYYIFEQKQQGAPEEPYEVIGKGKRAKKNGGLDADSISFEERDEPEMLDGRQATVFQSRQPVPLCERPGQENYQFTLKKTGSDDEIKLPFATPAAMKRDLEGDKRMYSEIFVYLGRKSA